MEKQEYEYLDSLLKNYGPLGVIRGLARVMKVHSDSLSDLGLKEQAKESAELSDCLKDLLVE